MKKNILDTHQPILKITLLILISFFLLNIFLNIQYPLLWNDEAETAAFADRILRYGYPKVNDGKNLLCPFEPADKVICINKKSDAYLGQPWVHFYFTVPWVFLTRGVNNLYLKTAILRTPFAIIGLIGLLLLSLTLTKLFKSNKIPIWVTLLFFFSQQVSLTLHLREVRYFSILILLFSCWFYFTDNFWVKEKFSSVKYILFTTVSLILIFNTLSLMYFTLLFTSLLFALWMYRFEKTRARIGLSLIPVLISFFFVVPLIFYFRTFELAKVYEAWFKISNGWRITNLFKVIGFLGKHNFLYLVIILKCLIYPLHWYLRPKEKVKIQYDNMFVTSLLLSIFFVIHYLALYKVPVPIIFERYYILLQPVLILILVLDIYLVYHMIPLLVNKEFSKWLHSIVSVCLFVLILWGTGNNFIPLKNHIYELFHRYEGPLDYIIPYLKNQYQHTERLVIATNYEEFAYMYYLDSKVTIGYLGLNLPADLKIIPDVIVYRKRESQTITPQLFLPFFQQVKYRKVSFPVFDYHVNNIPELAGPLPHLFKTKWAGSPNQAVDIYLKIN